MLNLDTHILIYALLGTLNKRESKLLSDNKWGISGIVLWEITKLSQKGRIPINLSDEALSRTISRLTVWPITPEICQAMETLDFKSDPADEIIAATSIVHRAALMTRDKVLLKSKIVPKA